ncbi:prenyltransferase/squalene oxidase repeat-containing protein [Sunxiuqinia sp. sy24]|uniref:prenyltransferase/squalene oxidase repeat-containing protein n=1 Tax=Sunxiuqinia sp. sy24 TaxID=3461495 RepID=UPI00404528EA
MIRDDLQKRFEELSGILLEEMNPEGYWTGELSSSALGVAVAIAALHFHDKEANQAQIQKGLSWLHCHVNVDGSFGDTPESPGNMSTSLLVYAATSLYVSTNQATAALQTKISCYLAGQGIDVHAPQVAEAILSHYQKDYTFSVPILTMCGLCGVPGKEAFRHIPQLPFELSLLPRSFYRMLNLSVVSYAIPALIAVGIVVFKKKKSSAFGRSLRSWSINPALDLLQKLMPSSGGFLEAIPLTAFVCLSLIEAGYKDREVVDGGIQFLKRTQREDGSWPIDINLSTWVTTLSVKALRNLKNEVLRPEVQMQLANHLKRVQNLAIHPFNGSRPGGWGWTNYSGAVPDGDDTPGAILALLQLQDREDVKKQVLEGCDWLLQLQNKDGGFPTFSRGWGKLPFDQSCADLTGHGLLALSACVDAFEGELDRPQLKRYRRAFNRSLSYLQNHQRSDGSWLPLWFGNQQTVDHSNPVYGTAKVLTYLKDAAAHGWMAGSIQQQLQDMIGPGEQFLVSVQNSDGSWGGAKGIAGSMEETALAVSALSGGKANAATDAGLGWLDHYYQHHGLKASPIGLYFASLWYDEKLYPLTAYLEALGRMQGA